MSWVNDWVSVSFGRQQAPVLVIPKVASLGADAVALMQGVLTNQRGQAVVVSWFGLPTNLGNRATVKLPMSLLEVVDFSGLSARLHNAGRPSELLAPLERMRQAWRTAAEEEMARLREERRVAVRPRLQEAERRVRKWANQRKEKIEKLRVQLSSRSQIGFVERDRSRLADEETRVIQREHERVEWVKQTLATDERAHVRLVLVLAAR
jgi:hypothetical protein